MLYWTDWSTNHPGIYRAPLSNVSSSTRQPVITTDITWPNALAIDFSGKYTAVKRLQKVNHHRIVLPVIVFRFGNFVFEVRYATKPYSFYNEYSGSTI